MPSDRAETKRLVRFVLVGGFNTLVTYGVFLLLLWAGLHRQLALAGDYATGIAIGYLLNRVWTFGDRDHKTGSFVKYVATYIVFVYAANVVLLEAIVATGLHPAPAQAIAQATVTILSYLAQKHWVFRHTGPTTVPADA